MMDFPVPVASIGRLRIPKSFNGRNPAQRRELANALRSRADSFATPERRTKQRESFSDTPTDREIGRLRADLKSHPCHQCPDREDHARWAERWFKLQRDTETLKRRVENRTNTVARTFDRVCDVLTALGYLEGDRVTEQGGHLRRIYTDMDLVAAEAIRAGVLDELAPSELAAVLSALVFEARRADDASSPRLPGGRVQPALGELVRLWGQLDALEREHKLDFLREPDLGFAWAAWRWAEGDDLDDVLMVTGLSAGDFVRWMKQLLDLCGQVADAAGDAPLRSTARATAAAIKRGVVAYSVLAE
jgi:ATP-dependent RNA helicase HelY